MNAGSRDQRITIQSRASTVSATGATTGSWSTVLARSAAVKAVSGRETSADGIPLAAGTFIFTVATPTAVTVNQRIGWKGRTFNIVAIDDSARDLIKITAVDGQQREA